MSKTQVIGHVRGNKNFALRSLEWDPAMAETTELHVLSLYGKGCGIRHPFLGCPHNKGMVY